MLVSNSDPMQSQEERKQGSTQNRKSCYWVPMPVSDSDEQCSMDNISLLVGIWMFSFQYLWR